MTNLPPDLPDEHHAWGVPKTASRPGKSSMRQRNIWTAVALVVALLVGVAIGAAGKPAKTVAASATGSPSPSPSPTGTPSPTPVPTPTAVPTPEPTPEPTAVPTPEPISDGTLVVGSDIQPGVYKTSGEGDGSNSVGCYYARLSSLESSDIIDNGIVKGPTTIQIKKTDKAVEFSGGCTWVKIG